MSDWVGRVLYVVLLLLAVETGYLLWFLLGTLIVVGFVYREKLWGMIVFYEELYFGRYRK